MKPQVQVIRKAQPEPVRPAPRAVEPEPEVEPKSEAKPEPQTGSKGSLEKQFVKELLADKLLDIRLSTGVALRGRLLYWDKYTFGIAPDNGTMPMMVHKEKLVSIQPVGD